MPARWADTGRRALDLPSRYTAKEQELLAEAPVTPESDSDHWSQWDPTQDPEHIGTSVPVADPAGIQNVVRDVGPSSEGEAHITISGKWRAYAERYETAHLQQESETKSRNEALARLQIDWQMMEIRHDIESQANSGAMDVYRERQKIQ